MGTYIVTVQPWADGCRVRIRVDAENQIEAIRQALIEACDMYDPDRSIHYLSVRAE